MSNYITGKELIDDLGIRGFELIDYAKRGLQFYDLDSGRRIVDTDSLDRDRKDSYEEIEYLVRLEEGTKQTGHLITHNYQCYHPPEPLLTEDEIKQKAKAKYEAQPLDTIIPPEDNDCILMSFTIPGDRKKAIQHIVYFSNCLIKTEALELFRTSEASHSLEEIQPETEKPERPARKPKLNQMHKLMLKVNDYLAGKHGKEPTSGEVCLAIERDFRSREKGGGFKYDTEEIIEKIEEETIHWIDDEAKQHTIKKGKSFECNQS